MSLSNDEQLYGRAILVRFLSTSAFYLCSASTAWLVYERTGSALELAALALTLFLPMALATPIIGVSLDTWNRGTILSVSLLVQILIVAGLAVAAYSWAGTRPLLIGMGSLGLARSLDAASISAIEGTISKNLRSMQKAMAISAFATYASHIIGPSLAGLLSSLTPTHALVGACTLFGMAGALAFGLRQMQTERSAPSSYTQGIKIALKDRVLAGSILIYSSTVFFAGLTGLLPIFAKLVFAVDVSEFGYLRAAPGVGALAASLLLIGMPQIKVPGRMMMGAAILFGMLSMLFSASRDYHVALAILVLSGAAINVCLVARTSLINVRCPENVRGGIAALQGLAVAAAYQLGEVQSTLLAYFVGPTSAAALGGGLCITLCIVAVWWIPELVRFRPIAAPLMVSSPFKAPRGDSQ